MPQKIVFFFFLCLLVLFKPNGLILQSESVDMKMQNIQALWETDYLVVSDCFSVAEIIFIPHFVQLLFVRERMQQGTFYFDGFLFSLTPLCLVMHGLILSAILRLIDKDKHLHTFVTSTEIKKEKKSSAHLPLWMALH